MSDTYCFDTGFLFSANLVQILPHFYAKLTFFLIMVHLSPYSCTKFSYLYNIVQILLFICTKHSFCNNIVQILPFACTKCSCCYKIVQLMVLFCTILFSESPSCNSKGPQNGLRYGWQSIPDEPNFLTRKCLSASQKRHFLKQTEIFRPIWNDCLRHLMIFCGPFCCSQVFHYI